MLKVTCKNDTTLTQRVHLHQNTEIHQNASEYSFTKTPKSECLGVHRGSIPFKQCNVNHGFALSYTETLHMVYLLEYIVHTHPPYLCIKTT